MATPLTDPRAARDAVLARVRSALKLTGDRGAARAAAEAYLAARAQGPRPRIDGDLTERFVLRAGHMASTVERLADRSAAPGPARSTRRQVRISRRTGIPRRSAIPRSAR